MVRLILVGILCYFSGFWVKLRAQDVPSKAIADIVYLDSIVVSASKAGFSVHDFIDLVRNDLSFYQAFKNLRYTSHHFSCNMQFVDRKEKIKASLRSTYQQTYENGCREMKVLKQEETGNLKKRKKVKYKYYTASMFDRLFVIQGKVCDSLDESTKSESYGDISNSHVEELKKIVFSPGSKSQVPFIGKKTEIFSARMRPYYDYSIRSEVYKDSTACYVFEASLKPAFINQKEGKTVIKYLATYFSKNNLQVVARKYRMMHKKALYQFDVSMEVELTQWKEHYLPEYINYDGFWNIPAKKKEAGSFKLHFYDFK